MLGSLSKNYFDILWYYMFIIIIIKPILICFFSTAWDRTFQQVIVGLKDNEGIVRYHSAKFLEDFTKALLDLETNGVATRIDVCIFINFIFYIHYIF